MIVFFTYNSILSNLLYIVNPFLYKINMDSYKKWVIQLEEIRKKCGSDVKLDLPQIVVIGDQSSGKSSLLSSLFDIPFPENSGTTTRCPIIVYTKNKNTETTYTITIDDKKYNVKKNNFSNKILEIQKKIIGKNHFSTTPITIEAEGYDLVDLVLVDLPGIISNGSGQKDVLEMITEHIEPEQSLILVVTEATKDEETAKALELARKYDPTNERTIRILTKYDMFDSEKSTENANKLVSTISPLSAHAIICRPKGESYNSEEENKILSEYNIPKERSGVKALKQRLPLLLNDRIQRYLPILCKDIECKLRENRNNVKDIGEKPPDNTEIIRNIQHKLKDTIIKGDDYISIECKITSIVEKLSEKINKYKIDKDLIEKYYRYNAFTPLFFEGESVFRNILQIINKEWNKYVDEFIIEILGYINTIFCFDNFTDYKKCLIDSIRDNWEKNKIIIMNNFRKDVNIELEKEKDFATLNHYLHSKYEERLALPDECIKEITKAAYYYNDEEETDMNDTIIWNDEGGINVKRSKENLKKKIHKILEDYRTSFIKLSISEQTKERILAACKAYYPVSKKTFIDNILIVSKKTIIDSIKEWIENFISDKKIRKNIGEDPSIHEKRENYKKKISILEDCLSIINNI